VVYLKLPLCPVYLGFDVRDSGFRERLRSINTTVKEPRQQSWPDVSEDLENAFCDYLLCKLLLWVQW
jgi:hypothetical protein